MQFDGAGLKVFFLEGGKIETKKHHLFKVKESDSPYVIPIPFYLIDHPKVGPVLFDTGMAHEAAHDAEGYYGKEVVSIFKPVVKEDELCVKAIQQIGFQAEDIAYVILSHLHADHAGGVGMFPNAKYVVQRTELHQAYVPEPHTRGGYVRKDFDKEVDWLILEGWKDNEWDLCGDGSVMIYFTPGHSPGHQSILLNLPSGLSMFLAGDACQIVSNMAGVPSASSWNESEALKTIERIKRFRNQNVTIITGHDQDEWQNFKKAPEFYN